MIIGLALFFGGVSAAQAAPISDPQGDFIPSYTGPKGGDLDVLSIQGVYNGVTLRLDGVVNGAPGTTAGGSYIWGLQRGAGTARLAAQAPGVLFDATVSITPGGATTVRDLASGVSTTLPASATVISGNKVSVTFNASLLPNLGLATPRYLINLWPRGAAGISDFAPDNSDAPLTLAFPTPASAAAQTDLAIDDSSVAFDRLAERLRSGRRPDGTARLEPFLAVYGQTGDHGLDGSFVGKHDGWALTGGLDTALGAGVFVGVAGRGGRTTATLTDGSHLTMDTLGGTAFADWSRGPWFADVFVDAAQQQFKSSRAFLIGPTAIAAAASPKGDTISGGGQIGYELRAGKYALIPAADLIATRSRVGSYQEIEPLGFGASVDARSRQSDRLGLGVTIEQTETPAWGSLFLHGSVRYVQELGDRADSFTYAFNAQPENRFLLGGVKTGRDYEVVDVGFDASVDGQAKVSVDYAPRFDGRGLMDHQFSVSARFTF
ncbi:MAG TPA: autotransporter outer membrane beta-barrel domain-containing protein [Caulobacteraceae bacterium]